MSMSITSFEVWFQNRRAKMRRQLKLQGQLERHPLKRDQDEAPSTLKQTEKWDRESWERQQEGLGYPLTETPAAVLSVRKQPVTRRLGKWERPEGRERLSSEELRSCSIAKLRAKAREHKAEINSTVNMSGGDLQSQTQETDAMFSDWSCSFFLFSPKMIKCSWRGIRQSIRLTLVLS